MSGKYLTAAVCVRGHAATDSVEFGPAPGKFCQTCGGTIITACQSCNASIRGDYYVPGVLAIGGSYTPPAYCVECGKPFPWTAEKVAAAKELTDELEGVSSEDRDKIKQALDDVTSDGPRTALGAARLKKLLGNAGGAVGKAAWKIAVEIASEAAKKVMLGQ